MSPSTLISLLTATASFLLLGEAKKLPNVYWNSSSTIFDISNTDHVMTVNIGDQVSIICPEPGQRFEYSALYLVSEEEYQHCTLMGNPRELGSCTDESRQSSLSVVFRKYSPVPGGLEFQPGTTYHVITTSDGTEGGLDNRKGGLCESAQMKVKFEVAVDRHHIKQIRTEERSYNPKFAARTVDRVPSGDVTSVATGDDATQVMYIIHDGNEGGQENDDDSVSSSSPIFAIATVAVALLLG